MLRVSWRVCRCYVWLLYVCGLASIVIAGFIVDIDERFECSIGRERLNSVQSTFILGLCSRSEIHAKPIDSNRTEEQPPPSKQSFEYARLSSLTGATFKHHTRPSSKFKTAVLGDDTFGGLSTPPILPYTPNLVTSHQGYFYGPSDLDVDLTDLTTSRQ